MVILAGFVFRKPNCSFVISDLREFKGQHGNENHYIVYEGLLKNTSSKRHYLNAMIANVYNSKRILISDGYLPVQDWIAPQTSIPFKINTLIDTLHDTAIQRYFDIKDNFSPDVYPWFTTCK